MLKEVEEHLNVVSQTIAAAQAEELCKLTLNDPELSAKRELIHKNIHIAWSAALDHADALFGHDNVSSALGRLGRSRRRM
mgnify:CR=1 FL=1